MDLSFHFGNLSNPQAKAPCRYLRLFVGGGRWEPQKTNTSQHIFNLAQRWGWTRRTFDNTKIMYIPVVPCLSWGFTRFSSRQTSDPTSSDVFDATWYDSRVISGFIWIYVQLSSHPLAVHQSRELNLKQSRVHRQMIRKWYEMISFPKFHCNFKLCFFLGKFFVSSGSPSKTNQLVPPKLMDWNISPAAELAV